MEAFWTVGQSVSLFGRVSVDDGRKRIKKYPFSNEWKRVSEDQAKTKP